LIIFSEAMDRTPTEAAISLTTAAGTIVPANRLWNQTGTECTLQPEPALASATEYVVTIATTARDLRGNALESVFRSSFLTDDPTATTVLSVGPADGATGVPVATTVVMLFAKEMDRASVEEAFALSEGGNPVPGVFTWETGSRRVLFTPYAFLRYGRVYQIRLAPTAADRQGMTLPAEFIARFSTTTQ
jgi:hypothetical protein